MGRFIMEPEGQGQLAYVTVPDPAVGDDFSVTVPSGGPTERWLVHQLRFQYVTDANAVNRAARVNIGLSVIPFENPLAAANELYTFSLGCNMRSDWNKLSYGKYFYLEGFPNPCHVLNGQSVYTDFQNMQAGDQIQNIELIISKYRVSV